MMFTSGRVDDRRGRPDLAQLGGSVEVDDQDPALEVDASRVDLESSNRAE
jgi:hypothetical protein